MQKFRSYTVFWCPYVITHNTLISKYTDFYCPQNQPCVRPYCNTFIFYQKDNSIAQCCQRKYIYKHFFYSQKKTPLSLDLVKMYSEPRRPFHARSEADLLMEAKANPQQQMICQQRANSDWMLSSEKRLKSPSKLSFEFSNIFTMKYKGSNLKKITYVYNFFLNLFYKIHAVFQQF